LIAIIAGYRILQSELEDWIPKVRRTEDTEEGIGSARDNTLFYSDIVFDTYM